MEKKDTNQLIDILNFSQEDYEPIAVQIIKEILLARNVDQSTIDDANFKYQNILRNTSPKVKTQQRIPKIPKFLLYIMYFAALAMASYLIKIFRDSIANNIVLSSKEEQKPIVKKEIWDEDYKSSIIIWLNKSPLLAKMKEKYKKPFCDCFVNKLQVLYPNGFIGKVSQGTKDTIVGDCAEKVKAEIH